MIWAGGGTDFAGVLEGVLEGSRYRAAGVVPGVTLPGTEGVRRPVDAEGVIRPLDRDTDGVILPPRFADTEGVIRPLREDATDDGRFPTVGGDSFVVATNTPHWGGQVKYCFLMSKSEKVQRTHNEEAYPATDPSFFPLPANPPLSSTPAQRPGFPSISPTNRSVPS